MTRKGIISLFALGGVMLLCACIFAFNARRLALWAAGFRHQGETASILEGYSKQGLPEPLVFALDGQPLYQVTIQFDGLSALIDTQALGLTRAEQAQTGSGETAYVFEYDEQALNAAVAQAVISAAPPELKNQLRSISVDLVPNAAVVSAEANLGLFWQPLAMVVTIDSASKAVDVTGVDVGGQFFTTPPSGPIATWVALAEIEGTRALREATLVGPNGQPLSVSQVTLTESGLQVIAR